MGLFFHLTISHKSPPCKTGTTKLVWVNTFFHEKKGLKLQQKFKVLLGTTKANVLDCFPSISHKPPPGKRNHKIYMGHPFFHKIWCLSLNYKSPKLRLIPLRRIWNETGFSIYIIQITPWKTGTPKFTWLKDNPLFFKKLGFKPQSSKIPLEPLMRAWNERVFP